MQSVQSVPKSGSAGDHARSYKRLSHVVHLFAGRFRYQLFHKRFDLSDSPHNNLFDDQKKGFAGDKRSFDTYFHNGRYRSHSQELR